MSNSTDWKDPLVVTGCPVRNLLETFDRFPAVFVFFPVSDLAGQKYLLALLLGPATTTTTENTRPVKCIY